MSMPESPSPGNRPKVLLIALAVLGLVLVGAAAIGGAIYVPYAMLQMEKPYRMALDLLRKDSKVIDALGEPIEDITWFPEGEVNTSREKGDALLSYTVAGPKGKAHVYLQAQRIGGVWGLGLLTVTTESGQEFHPVLTRDAAGLTTPVKWDDGK
jgi:hypothetical protein